MRVKTISKRSPTFSRASTARMPLSDQTLYGFDVTDPDRTLAEVDQPLAVPGLKLLVDALPAAGRHIAQLALGDMKLDRRATDAMGRPTLSASCTSALATRRLEMPKHHVLDLFGRQPQSATQDPKQDQAKIRPLFVCRHHDTARAA